VERAYGVRTAFLRHEFLLALEESGCASRAPAGHRSMRRTRGLATAALSGAMPLYRKTHSRGEFVFDFAWANAYAQHGLKYYPKLLSAMPFTPRPGPRLLVDPPVADQSAIDRSVEGGEGLRPFRNLSWHVLFPSEAAT
jgi:predicted N-acyltransferase